MEQRKREVLSELETAKVIEVWRSYFQELRGSKRNSLVLLKMCKKLEIVHSLKSTPTQLRATINSLIKKFRSEKKNNCLSGGSPSDWIHYKEISSFFVPRQPLYRPYLDFNDQQRTGMSKKNFSELASQETAYFKRSCVQTLELMAPSYFLALSQRDNNISLNSIAFY